MAPPGPFARPTPPSQAAGPAPSSSAFLSLRSAPTALAPSQSFAPFCKVSMLTRPTHNYSGADKSTHCCRLCCRSVSRTCSSSRQLHLIWACWWPSLIRGSFQVSRCTLLCPVWSSPCPPTGSLFNVLPPLLFFPFAFLGALPVIVLRKRTITSELLVATSRSVVADGALLEQLPFLQLRLVSRSSTRFATPPPCPSSSPTSRDRLSSPSRTFGARPTSRGILSSAPSSTTRGA